MIKFSYQDLKELKYMLNELSFYLQHDIQNLKTQKINEDLVDDKLLDFYNVNEMGKFITSLLKEYQES